MGLCARRFFLINEDPAFNLSPIKKKWEFEGEPKQIGTYLFSVSKPFSVIAVTCIQKEKGKAKT